MVRRIVLTLFFALAAPVHAQERPPQRVSPAQVIAQQAPSAQAVTQPVDPMRGALAQMLQEAQAREATALTQRNDLAERLAAETRRADDTQARLAEMEAKAAKCDADKSEPTTDPGAAK